MQLLFSVKRLRLVGYVAALSLTALTSGCSTLGLTSEKTAVSDTASDTQVTAPTGIAKLLSYLTPYHTPIQQGNFVSQEMVAELKNGMTREQVSSILGTPLLTDMFHEDRWDYPFRLRKSNGDIISSHVVIYFKNNSVVKFDGTHLPTEKEYLAQISSVAIKDTIEVNPESESQKKE